MMGRNIWGFDNKFDNIGCFSLFLADTNRKYYIGTQPTLSPITAWPSTHQSLFSLVASSISQYGDLVPALAVALSSTLGQHHGEKTKKEINLAVQAVCSMDSVVELWTWNALSWPLTLNQVTLSLHLIPPAAGISKGLVKFTPFHSSKCSCFLCGYPCFLGCWWASCLW